MRAVRCEEGRISLVEVPLAEGEGVRVRVRSAGICGSDLHMLDAGFPLSHTLGHEIAGVLRDGRAVAVEPIRGCATCDFCRAGAYNLWARSAHSSESLKALLTSSPRSALSALPNFRAQLNQRSRFNTMSAGYKFSCSARLIAARGVSSAAWVRILASMIQYTLQRQTNLGRYFRTPMINICA